MKKIILLSVLLLSLVVLSNSFSMTYEQAVVSNLLIKNSNSFADPNLFNKNRNSYKLFPTPIPTPPSPIPQIPAATLRCIDVLPYKPYNINYTYYYTWFGKLGENLNGTVYQNGHVFTRHVAVGYKCTDQQKKDNKTVFYDENEFYKALGKDNTNCTMTNQKQFNFNQNHNIAAPSDYIKGIDCTTGQSHLFPSYFVEYKRAIQNAHPSQADYMASNKVTVWTFYPKR